MFNIYFYYSVVNITFLFFFFFIDVGTVVSCFLLLVGLIGLLKFIDINYPPNVIIKVFSNVRGFPNTSVTKTWKMNESNVSLKKIPKMF